MASKIKDYSEDFFNKAKELHGDNYNYDNSKYINSRTKLTILCNKCNTTFEQLPTEHIRIRKTSVRGYTNNNGGCPTCKLNYISEYSKLSIKEYIDKANKIHNNKYSYLNTEQDILETPVKGDKSIKITIECPKHGLIKVSKLAHIDVNHPQGCIECSNFNKELIKILKKENEHNLEDIAKNTFAIFYILKFNNFYKYGLTTKSIKQRYRHLKNYETVQEINTNLYTAVELETLIEKYCQSNNLKIYPSLLKNNGISECFTLTV